MLAYTRWAGLGLVIALTVQGISGDGCLFEGQMYRQGETWTKQCQYNCVCDDGSTGHYTCTNICPTYDNLPAGCTLVKPPGEPCCAKPQCTFATIPPGNSQGGGEGGFHLVLGGGSGSGSQGGSGTVIGGGSTSCADKLTNCQDYGDSVCSDSSYTQWVSENCAAFCGVCGGSIIGGSGVGTIGGGAGGIQIGQGGGSCVDAIQNCAQYGTQACSGQYVQWATQNCARYCGLCGGVSVGGGTMGGAAGTGTIIGGGVGTGGTGTGGTGTGGYQVPPIGTGSGSTGTGGYQVPPVGGGSGTVGGSVGGGGVITPGGDGGVIIGSGTCMDTIQTCNQYEPTTCTDPQYDAWAKQNCALTCRKCGGGQTGTGTIGGGLTGTGTVGGSQTGTGTVGGGLTGTGTVGGGLTGTGTVGGGLTGTGTVGGSQTGTGTGGGQIIPGSGGIITGSCTGDKNQNCVQYGTGVCTNPSYTQWVQDNCCQFCRSFVSGGGTSGTGTVGGGGTSGTGTGSGSGISGTGTIGGGGTSGTGTGSGGGIIIGGGPCGDTNPNCAQYLQSGQNVCTDPSYDAWAKENCARSCNKCGSGGSMGTVSGTGSGTQTQTGSGGTITGSSTGCAYKGQVYSQGQTWNDECTFRCTCINASQGQYNCQALCYTFSLPPACSMVGPAPGKCCKTPSCPAGVNIQYPAGYTEN